MSPERYKLDIIENMFCSSYAQLKINIHANQCEYTVLHIFTQMMFWAETRVIHGLLNRCPWVIIKISTHPYYHKNVGCNYLKKKIVGMKQKNFFLKKIVYSKKLTPNVFRENFSDWSLVK